ncbi:MAG TPA: hypothetical protein VGK73_13215, partial [Polyangiaceae bacterium]
CAAIFPAETVVPCAADADCGEFRGACGKGGRCFAPLLPETNYELVTTEYLAAGGSGLFDPILGPYRSAGDDLCAAVSEAVRLLPAARVEGRAWPVLDEAAAARDGRIRFEAP